MLIFSFIVQVFFRSNLGHRNEVSNEWLSCLTTAVQRKDYTKISALHLNVIKRLPQHLGFHQLLKLFVFGLAVGSVSQKILVGFHHQHHQVVLGMFASVDDVLTG